MDQEKLQRIVERVNGLETRLGSFAPDAIEEAKGLADTVLDPKTASRSDIWSRIWDKPLYANAKVAVADRWAEQLRPFVPSALAEWGGEGTTFRVTKLGKGMSNDSYGLEGSLAGRIGKEVRTARYRLYRIQGAAIGLRSMPEKSPFKAFLGQPLDDVVSTLRKAFGEGWGTISILHALTDVGLAAKPDLHLVRTCEAVELLDELHVSDIPSPKQCLEINQRISALCIAKYGSANAWQLRYIDKLFMEISRSGLLDTQEGKDAPLRSRHTAGSDGREGWKPAIPAQPELPGDSWERGAELEYLEICKLEKSEGAFKLSIEFPGGAPFLRAGYIAPQDLVRLTAVAANPDGGEIRGDEYPLEITGMEINCLKRAVKLRARQMVR
ncbi:hypothetical protein LZ190_06680 [Rhodovulum sulfidophilum]|nr:hypothetical protein [Rhodovulum sulfidophilum]